MVVYNVRFQGKEGDILMIIQAMNSKEAREKFNRNISIKKRRIEEDDEI